MRWNLKKKEDEMYSLNELEHKILTFLFDSLENEAFKAHRNGEDRYFSSRIVSIHLDPYFIYARVNNGTDNIKTIPIATSKKDIDSFFRGLVYEIMGFNYL